MTAWLAQNQAAVDTGVSVLMALIWLVYLQIFVASTLRQRRSSILVNTGVGVGMQARCFISNLGYEPVYLNEILVRLNSGGRTATAVITDRRELSDEALKDPDEATNQGPLRTGHMTDIGSFHDLFERARGQVEEDFAPERIDRLELIVVANTASVRHVGASRAFCLTHAPEGIRMKPETLDTHQIRGRRARGQLRSELEALMLD